MNALAWMWAVTGERLKQRSVFRAGHVEASPEDASYRDTLGWIYFRLGRKADAAGTRARDPARAREPALPRNLGWYTRPADALRMRAPNGGAHWNCRLLPRPTTLRSTARRSRRR